MCKYVTFAENWEVAVLVYDTRSALEINEEETEVERWRM